MDAASPSLDSLSVGLEPRAGHALGHVIRIHQGRLNGFDGNGPILHMLPEVVGSTVIVSGAGGQLLLGGQSQSGVVVAKRSAADGCSKWPLNFQLVGWLFKGASNGNQCTQALGQAAVFGLSGGKTNA